MIKRKSQFICQQCGAVTPKWSGRCEQCGEWNSLVEQTVETGKSVVAKSSNGGTSLDAKILSTIEVTEKGERIKTGVADLDGVLGGGIVPGGVALLAGQPGIGKSTLLMQLSAHIAGSKKVLYVSGEESASQVKLRAERLKADGDIAFVSSTVADDIAATIREGVYDLVIIDSIQTLAVNDITSAPGTVSQITNSSSLVMRAAKQSGSAVIVVGHVTKEGSIAGPKVLEHLVDVVLQFEGDRYGGYKVVRAVKNRYGSTSESVIFEMKDTGLEVVKNISAALLEERSNTDGSVIFAAIEGTQAVLCEIQALVNPTNFGYPKRTASGFDGNRLNVLIAVLERRTKLTLSDKDIYINVVGGLKLQDPAADLAVCMAIASAAANMKLDDSIVVFGEVGLGGEIRSVANAQKRVKEAKKLGFSEAIAPKSGKNDGFITHVSDVRQALIQYLKQ